jgi:drug/metabolite transporter (DMT)-like permease
VIFAYLAALGSALCYGLGSVLQSIGAKRHEAGDRLDARSLARVVSELPYLGGLGLDGVGWVLSLVALVRLPLFVVQAVVAGAIGFVVLFAALLEHVRPTTRQVAFLVALGVGLLGLALSGAPEAAHRTEASFAWGMWIALVVIGIAGVLVPRFVTPRHASAVLGALAGFAFGGTALCARSIAGDIGFAMFRDPLTFAMVVFGVLGMAFYTAALQRGTVTIASAWMFTAETVIPAIVGLAVLGDRARTGLEAVAIVAFVIAVGAAVGLTLVSPPME